MNTRLALVPRRLLGAGVAATVMSATLAAAPWAQASTPGPSISSLSPTFGKVGTTVTITTSGFDATQPATVQFGSSAPEAEPATAWSGQQLAANVPSDATTGKVTVAQGANTATSANPFTVTVPATATAAAYPHRVTWPHRATVTAHLTDANGPVVSHWGHLQSKVIGSSRWRKVSSVGERRTGSDGRVTFHVAPTEGASYRVFFPASPADRATTSSPTAIVNVISRVRLHVPRAIPQVSTVQLTGTSGPAPHGSVDIQRAVGRRWRTIATAPLHHGNFAANVSFAHLGTVRLRAVRPADKLRLAGTSAVAVAQVVQRTLQQGDSGPDVLALQRELRRLHYDVGAVNGSYGFDTFHAVTAFQKVNRLNDDGQVGLSTWKALERPRRLRLEHPMSGTAVEVNLARQVVIIAKNGRVWRIIDSSTAGGYYYTNSAGQQEKAITPTGHFTIQYKQEGWQHSSLGYLYRPAYFTNTGYAIHGETAVPPYPASHGCVRITVPAMDRYYNTFYVGESVWIYGNPPPGHE